ncbi:MAG: DUF2975 domain-containing protein [Hyphomicrobiales bacterium]|nr:DUF2975 domain-containing protein [Hyphomicrobiales bacterium]
MSLSGTSHSHLANLTPVQGRLALLCQSARFLAVGVALIEAYSIVSFWLDPATVIRVYGRWLKNDISGFATWQQASAFALDLIVWAMVVAACFAVWQLFTGFLRGRVLTADSAAWLMHGGIWGGAAVLVAIALRPAKSILMSLHLPQGQTAVSISLMPQDVMNLMFCAIVVALAYILKSAAEMAEENRQIV